MPDTLISVSNDVLNRLGDTAQDVWTLDEIRRYVREGYDNLAAQTGMLWDTAYMEDQSTVGNITAEWERDYLESGWLETGVFVYTSPADADFAPEGMHHLGPTNHNHLWEEDNGHVSTFHGRAVHDLPADLYEIERATWNHKRVAALRSTELEQADSRYELTQGEVLGYVRDKDGINKFRKWKIPSAAADEYTVTGSWGGLRDVSDITATVTGSWGICRRLPGVHPCGSGYPWGGPRRIFKESGNTRIEYSRRGRELTLDGSEFELPDRYVKYIRHYAQGHALERQGPGQDEKIAELYMTLYGDGVARVKRRMAAVHSNRRLSLTGENYESKRPPLARMPWNYGPVVR